MRVKTTCVRKNYATVKIHPLASIWSEYVYKFQREEDLSTTLSSGNLQFFTRKGLLKPDLYTSTRWIGSWKCKNEDRHENLKKGSWSNEQINNCTCITQSNRSLSRGGHFVSRDKKRALYLHGHLVLTARLTVQKQSFLNLLGQNGPRDKGLFTFYGRRVNGPSENFLFLNLSGF